MDTIAGIDQMSSLFPPKSNLLFEAFVRNMPPFADGIGSQILQSGVELFPVMNGHIAWTVFAELKVRLFSY